MLLMCVERLRLLSIVQPRLFIELDRGSDSPIMSMLLHGRGLVDWDLFIIMSSVLGVQF